MSSQKLRVAVLFGGRSGEHEISLLSARSILSAMKADKYEVIQIGITHEGAWFVGENILDVFAGNGSLNGFASSALFADPSRRGLYSIRKSDQYEVIELLADIDVVFPILHGTFGEDGTVQGLFELAEIAYVGAGVLGSSLGMDKGVFRDVMRANNIPQVDTMVVLRSEVEGSLEDVIEQAEAMASYPIFTKPANLGSSVGITKCMNRSDLMEGLMDAARYDRRILVQKGVEAREIEVSVLGNDEPISSVPGEIVPSADFYSYEAKYFDEHSELLIPAPIPFEISQQIREIAVQAYRAIDCAGMARVDFLLDKATGQVFLNEVNTIPGFTKISMYPKLWEASGLSFESLIDRLIELALERRADRDQTQWRYQG
jgi:D-alanine-D-alanine ligase